MPRCGTILWRNIHWLSLSEFSHWGIHSIWAKAFKEGTTHLSKLAWYHYNRLLEIRKSSKKGKKPKLHPLRAESVNQIWHADITVFKTLDGIKHYIYTVMDNYSRFIHSWRIDTVVSADIRIKTIRDAIANAFGNESFDEIQLVTDGGPENDNLTVKDFVRSNNVNHTIALKDIVQSNSMMEAFYRTTKYQCLYLKSIADGHQLEIEFENWIDEYQYQKPHYALGIYAPFEIISGKYKNESFLERMNTATRNRREINKNVSCKVKCSE